ncbi:histidine-type phosphatase [Microbacterium sp. KR10-403]|uniref:histidine-type phosphatase n=1 Tax=Microbacterium sp. KR10-403 TaxID=3158581 RepID=UPI0032E3A95F
MAGALIGALFLQGAPAFAHGHGHGHDGGDAQTVRTTGNLYGTKAVYEPFQDASTYEKAPRSYHPVLVEHVSRHGARLLSSKKYDDLLWQLWQIADADDGLTDLGRELGADLQEIIAVHDDLGYGILSTLGAQEQEQIAERTVARMRSLFTSAVRQDKPISIVSSGVDRAVDSADSFVDGLEEAYPALAEIAQPQTYDKDLLYFHDTDPEYLEYEDSDQLGDVNDELEQLPAIETTARDVVSGLFTPEFIARIDAGEFDLVDSGKGSKHLKTVVDVASYIYELYVIAPGMALDADVDMTPYMSDEDAATFAYLSDAKDFYEKGPAFAGSDVTYEMSHVLVDAFLDSIEAAANGDEEYAAEFRFAHAEEIIPLAALLRLPGSTVQQSVNDLFTYDDNPWRGAQVAPMAANVQWDVYQGPHGRTIVKMLYNEQETAFAGDCRPIHRGSYFYTVDELTRCLADVR